MKVHAVELAGRLNEMIGCERRAVGERDLFSRRSGRKRTQLESVRAVPAGEWAGAGAVAVKSSVQGEVAHMGNSAWGGLAGGALTAEAINQGNLSDCYLLIAMLLIARLRPNFFDDIFVKVDEKTAVVQWYYGGYVLQIKTSLLVSTDYDHPANGDVRPELAEKTWCLVRAGLSDYAADDYGMIDDVFSAFGLDGSLGSLNSEAIIAAMEAGKAVGLQTMPTVAGRNSVEDWVGNHAYGVVDFDTGSRALTLVQPWHGAVRIGGVDAGTVGGGKVFNMMHVGAFPVVPRILAGMVAAAPVVAVATSAAVAAGIVLPAEGAVISADQCSGVLNCRVETQAGGMTDIGYVSGAAWAEFTLDVAAAGPYVVTFEAAAMGEAELDIAVNGAVQAGAVAVGATGAWNKFGLVSAGVELPAGVAVVRFSNRFGTQYNLGQVEIRPGVVEGEDPIVGVSVVVTRRSGRVEARTEG